MEKRALAQRALEEGQGVLRLAPTWVARPYCRPGRRLKLHPNEYYPWGLDRGAVGERWLASTTLADNGPLTLEQEGLSEVVAGSGERILLKEMVDFFQGQVIGERLYQEHRCWPAFSKFFDNSGPLTFHLHQRKQHAALVGQQPKPEMYFFPAQLNNTFGEFPFTFFGLNPGTTREQLRECLLRFAKGDNQILCLSHAYQLELDTGWDVPPGILHAPGSLCTYEPQLSSDIAAMYQSVVRYEQKLSADSLFSNCPAEKVGDVDYLIELLDWEKNLDPNFYQNRFMRPIPVYPQGQMRENGCVEEWICYRSSQVSAKRVTVEPGREICLKDPGAYGAVCIQGHGKFGTWDVENPTMIHFGNLTEDEFFVTEEAAKTGVKVQNTSHCEPLVLLQQFAQGANLPENI